MLCSWSHSTRKILAICQPLSLKEDWEMQPQRSVGQPHPSYYYGENRENGFWQTVSNLFHRYQHVLTDVTISPFPFSLLPIVLFSGKYNPSHCMSQKPKNHPKLYSLTSQSKEIPIKFCQFQCLNIFLNHSLCFSYLDF